MATRLPRACASRTLASCISRDAWLSEVHGDRLAQRVVVALAQRLIRQRAVRHAARRRCSPSAAVARVAQRAHVSANAEVRDLDAERRRRRARAGLRRRRAGARRCGPARKKRAPSRGVDARDVLCDRRRCAEDATAEPGHGLITRELAVTRLQKIGAEAGIDERQHARANPGSPPRSPPRSCTRPWPGRRGRRARRTIASSASNSLNVRVAAVAGSRARASCLATGTTACPGERCVAEALEHREKRALPRARDRSSSAPHRPRRVRRRAPRMVLQEPARSVEAVPVVDRVERIEEAARSGMRSRRMLARACRLEVARLKALIAARLHEPRSAASKGTRAERGRRRGGRRAARRVVAAHEEAAAKRPPRGEAVDPGDRVLVRVLGRVAQRRRTRRGSKRSVSTSMNGPGMRYELRARPSVMSAGEPEAADGGREHSAFSSGEQTQARAVASAGARSGSTWRPKVPSRWWFLPCTSLAMAPPTVTNWVPGVTGRNQPARRDQPQDVAQA